MVRITSARSKISQWNRGSVWAYPNQIPPGHRSNCSNFASRVPTGEGCNDRNRYGHDALGRFGRDDQAAAVPMRVPRRARNAIWTTLVSTGGRALSEVIRTSP